MADLLGVAARQEVAVDRRRVRRAVVRAHDDDPLHFVRRVVTRLDGDLGIVDRGLQRDRAAPRRCLRRKIERDTA